MFTLSFPPLTPFLHMSDIHQLGSNSIDTFGYIGKGVHCYYCKNCTSHVYHHQEILGDDTIVLRTGLLTEGIKTFKPAAEIFGKARLPWEKEVAQTFETLPPS